MDALNWGLAAIGTFSGIAILIAGSYKVFKYFCPMKIVSVGRGYYECAHGIKEYFVIVHQVEVRVRRPLITKARCIQIGDDKNCYPNAKVLNGNIESWEFTDFHTMRFAAEIYNEDEMPEDLRNKGVTKGRIVIGRCKSKWFDIKKDQYY
jgi:hypothetical protein